MDGALFERGNEEQFQADGHQQRPDEDGEQPPAMAAEKRLFLVRGHVHHLKPTEEGYALSLLRYYRHNFLYAGHRILLPEHREAFLDQERAAGVLPRPVLDPQQQEACARALSAALRQSRAVAVTVYHPEGFRTVCGRIRRLDPIAGRVEVVTEAGRRSVDLADIVDVVLVGKP